MTKLKKISLLLWFVLTVVLMCGITAHAAGSGDVAGAIEGTWNDASDQIKTVVNKVVFPAIDLLHLFTSPQSDIVTYYFSWNYCHYNITLCIGSQSAHDYIPSICQM